MFSLFYLRARKHPAPEGALKPASEDPIDGELQVRKHPAPQGALRLLRLGHPGDHLSQVRKHPAPEGALRPVVTDLYVGQFRSDNIQHHKVH